MKFRLVLLMGLIGLLFNTYAQIAVSGNILDEQGQAIPGVTVSISKADIKKGTTTDEEGYFSISLPEKGNYKIEARFVGFATYEQKLNITQDKVYNLGPVTLKEGQVELQTVEILGRSQRDYNSDYSFSATKTGIKNKELPQSLTAVTKEFIADRQAFQLADAVKGVSGVSPSSVYNQYNIRGISQNEEGQIINGMRTRQYYFLQPITSNVERVEVLKGPASVTFSSVDPGGSINIVTKKPLAEDRKEVSMSVGSFSTMRGALDFTGPLNESKTLLYRVNAGVQKAESYRDLVQNNALLVSPSISYVPDDQTAINVEMIYSNNLGTLDRGQPIFGAQAGVTDLNSTPISLNLGATNDYFQSEEWIMTTSLSRKLTDHISFNGAYMKQTWREDLEEHRTTNAFVLDRDGNAINDMVAMRFVQRQQFWDVDNLNAYFNFDLNTGGVNHKLLVGYDLHRWNRKLGGGQNSARGYLLNDGSVTNGYDPANADAYQMMEVNGVTMPVPNVAHFNLSNPSNTIKNVQNYMMNSVFSIPPNLSTTHATYVQEQLKLRKLTALLSARYELYEDITNHGLSEEKSFKNESFIPRLGLSYEVNKNVNVYATYLQGYQPQSNTVSLMPSTSGFFWAADSPAQYDPLISDLKEVGAKATMLDGAVTMSVALYEINQENILIPSADVPDLLVQRGADRSRGVEWDMSGYVLPNWQIFASYSYINAEIIEDEDESLEGARKENTPQNSANLWTRYDFESKGALKGLGLGLGMQYSGDKVPWFTRDFMVPAYTIFDAAVYYKPLNSNMQLMVKVNNLLDKAYWLGAQNYTRLFPGAPRNALLTVTYKF